MVRAITLFALVGTALALPGADNFHAIEERQTGVRESKYCSPTTSLCYNQYSTQGSAVIRIAIPDTAARPDFDIAFQIVSPRNTGWAALSWGGSMHEAPLAVAWPNGNNVMISSRWSTDYVVPSMYTGAQYTVLADTGVNGTHWTLSAICKGCSSWDRETRGAKQLNPSSSGIRIAWAQNTQGGSVSNPGNPSSSFSRHNNHNYINADFVGSKVSAASFSAAAARVRP